MERYQIFVLVYEEIEGIQSRDGNFYLYRTGGYTIFNFDKTMQYGFLRESSAQVFCKQKALEHQKG